MGCHRNNFGCGPYTSAEPAYRVACRLARVRRADQFGRPLEHLLGQCERPEDLPVGLLLLHELARPKIHLEKPLAWPQDANAEPLLRVEVSLVGDEDVLREAWSTFFRPEVGRCRNELRSLVSTYLCLAYRFMEASGHSGFDSLSYQRSAIESHEQDSLKHGPDVLIDIARDLLEFLIHNHPAEAESLTSEWLQMDGALFQRLAIHGMSLNEAVRFDDAIERVIHNRWLYKAELKHEVFKLLRHKFVHASDGAQRRLISHSMTEEVITAANEGTEARAVSDYERYNLAVWLQRVAPDSQVAREHLLERQAEHPEFGEREHLDLDHWVGSGSVGSSSPISVEALLDSEPGERLTELVELTQRGGGTGIYDREGLANAVKEAAARSFDWGLKLAEALCDADNWNSSLWAALLVAWRSMSLGPAQWSRVLALVSDTTALDAVGAGDITDLLENAVDAVDSLEAGQLDVIERVADRIFDGYAPEPVDEGEARRDWVSLAINSVPGRLTETWGKLLLRRRTDAGDDWAGLPEGYRDRFARILASRSSKSDRACTVLASQLHVIFALDAEWATANLVGLFDWRINPVRAVQAWSAFVWRVQPNEVLLALVLPHLQECFAKLDKELLESRDLFCRRLVGVALYSAVDPWHGGWLETFVREGSVDSRVAFAANMANEMRNLCAEAGTTIWNRWIKDYWDSRLTGVPRPLAEQEGA